MSSKDTKILQFSQYQNSDKTPRIICEDFESLIEKTDVCKNNSEKSFTTKVSEHIPSDFSISIISSFKNTEHKHDIYRVKIV